MVAKAHAQPEELVLPLRHKVDLNGNTWTEVKLRSPRFGELVESRTEEGGDRQTASLIAQVGKVERDAVDLFDYRDIRMAARYFAFFISGPLAPREGDAPQATPGETKLLMLRHEVTLNGETERQISLRPPRLGELVNARRAPTDDAGTASLISQITRIKLPMIDLMDCRDVREADDYLGFFVTGALPTGTS